MLEGCTPFPDDFAERYVRESIWRRETIPHAIATAALDRPEAVAIVDSTRCITYSQLVAEAGTLAALLSRNGIERNDRIVIQLPNCVEFATLTIACLEVGAIPVMALPACGPLVTSTKSTPLSGYALESQYLGFLTRSIDAPGW